MQNRNWYDGAIFGADVAGLNKIAWWQWFPGRSWRVVVLVDDADEVPQRLPRNGVAFVGSERKPKWLVFDCPCRTGHRIMLDLEPTRFPHWRAKTRPRLTVWPSVDYVVPNRRCHYFIRAGRISWIPGKEPSHD